MFFTWSSFSGLSVVSFAGALKGRGKVLPFIPSRDKGPVSSLWVTQFSHLEAELRLTFLLCSLMAGLLLRLGLHKTMY